MFPGNNYIQVNEKSYHKQVIDCHFYKELIYEMLGSLYVIDNGAGDVLLMSTIGYPIVGMLKKYEPEMLKEREEVLREEFRKAKKMEEVENEPF